MYSRLESKRICFLIGSMGKGGAERVISVIANAFSDKGWKVDILLLLDDTCDYNLNRNINLIPLCKERRSRVRQLPSWLFGIRRYVKEKKPDTIVSFIARINIITLLACFGLNKRVLVSERNDPATDGRSIFVRLATYILYPLAECIVFQTNWAKSCFPTTIQNKGVIIPNPINVQVSASDKKEKKIVAVGRLIEQKNHSMLIEAFKKVNKVYPEYKLIIYGEGKLRETLEKQIQNIKLEKSVFLPGSVTDIHQKISDAKIFVLSSNYEGLSNALLEAMFMGLPCISTDCAGSNEVIKNNLNGKLVPVGDGDRLATAIKELIEHDDLSIKLGEEAKETSKTFDSKNVLKKWEEILNNGPKY